MKVLALTHAHLSPEGLSPVSCERADSITGTWAGMPGWEVDVIHTGGTQWRGIWPGGKGLPINIIHADARPSLMMGQAQLFSAELKSLVAKKKLMAVATLAGNRIAYRLRGKLASEGMAMPHAMVIAEQWGKQLASLPAIKHKQYDFIFVCAGYGDEYLLQTAFTLSRSLHVPIIADLRDLWSDHHEPGRFTEKQRQHIRRHEQRIFERALMLSVPQQAMAGALEKWLHVPVYLASHSAHVDPAWKDGAVVSDEYRILYAGKLYAGSPGLTMLLELIQQLVKAGTDKPVRAVFYVDDTDKLRQLAEQYGITDHVSINGWVSPGDLWKEIRSAHLLITFDTGLTMPLIMTKTIQYAHSGRQILALYIHHSPPYETFFEENKSGYIYYTVPLAVSRVQELIKNKEQYEVMPPLRKVPTRDEIARTYGHKIEELMGAGKERK